LINIKYEKIGFFIEKDRCFFLLQKTTKMVETKQAEEKQQLLDAIDQERQTLANEVESKQI
jgi:hypothetical protein